MMMMFSHAIERNCWWCSLFHDCWE